MADLNQVTKKTLRVYQEAGLLRPVRVDEDTGYRYYGLEQCATIDMIQQLQALGFTLTDIREILGNDADHLMGALEERQRAIEESMCDLMIARQNVTQLLNNCRFSASRPIYDTVILEHIPEKHVIHFDIFNDRARLISEDVESVLEEWELNLRLTKKHMVQRGIPLALFHNVGCCVSKDNLLARNLAITSSFICVNDAEVAKRFGAVRRSAGTYLTMYKKSYTEQGEKAKRNAEREGLVALLDYADAHGMSVAGDYYGVIIGETPAFDYEGREMLLKLEVPFLLDD